MIAFVDHEMIVGDRSGLFQGPIAAIALNFNFHFPSTFHKSCLN
jgi:hypothetical protein